MTAATHTPARLRHYLTAAAIFGAALSVTYVGMHRYEMGPISAPVSAIIKQVCGFGGRSLEGLDETQRTVIEYTSDIVRDEPIWKRVGICVLTVYQPVKE